MIYQRLSEMAAVIAVVLVALAYLAIRGWRSRAAAQSSILPELPAEFAQGENTETSDVYYVVTTVAGEPLNRIMRFGLGNRGKASATLSASGLIIDRVGEETLFLDQTSISAIGTASATIDKAVERDGLLVITWSSSKGAFDTYLRVLNKSFRELILASFSPSKPTQKGN